MAQEGLVEERLSAREVDLLHADFFEEAEASLGLVFGHLMGSCRGVEAETAGFVALAREVVVYGYGRVFGGGERTARG